MSDGADGRTREPAGDYLRDEMLDRMARIELALLSELWVMRDRMAVMERLLIDRGMLPSGAIEAFRPDPAFEAHVDTLRDQMVETVLGAPYRNALTVEDLKAGARARSAHPIGKGQTES